MANDNELLFIMKMRDEASDILAKATESVRAHGAEADKAGKHVGSFRAMIYQAAGGANSFSGAIKKVGASMISLGAPVAGGIVAAETLMGAWQGVKNAFAEMIQNTVDYEKSQKSLSMALSITGNAVGMSKDQINELVDAQSDATLTDDTEVRQAAAQMLMIGRVGKDSFKPAMDAATQLSRVMGSDLRTAASTLARALADPEQGMNRLRRAGIILTEAEKDRIKTADITNGRMAAQSEMLAILTERIGAPAAGVSGKGLSGALKNAAYGWDAFLDQFNDSALSAATAGVVNLTAEVLKQTAKLTDWTKAYQESRAAAANGTNPGTGGLKLASPEMMASLANDDVKKQLAGLQKTRAEIQATFEKYQSAGSASAATYARELKIIDSQIAEASQKLADFDKAREKAMGNEAANQARELAEQIDKIAGKLGLAADIAHGGLLTKTLGDAQDLAKGAAKALDDARKGGDANTIAVAERAKAAADLKLINSDATTKAQRDAAQAASAGSGPAAAPRLAQQKAIDQAVLDGKNATDQAAAGQAAYVLAISSVNRAIGDQSAAFSRALTNQRALAKQYDISTVAANNLAAAQQAAENAITGKGGGSAETIMYEKFVQALVGIQKQSSATFDELIDLEKRAASAADPIAANIQKILEPTVKLRRELEAQIPLGNGSLTETAMLEKNVAVRRNAVAEMQKFYVSIQQGANQEIAAGNASIEQNEVKAKYAAASIKDEEIAIGLLKIELEQRKLLSQEITGATEEEKRTSKERRDAALAALDAQRENVRAVAESNEKTRQSTGALAQYIRQAADPWTDYQNAAVGALTGVEDAMAGFLTGAKDWQSALRDVVNSVLSDLTKIAVRQTITGPIAEGLGLATGTAGAGGGGSGGGIFGMLGKAASFASSFFADGGIMTSRGKVPLRKYAGGGVANSPQMAMFGEGSTPEAYVPVPSGRIPVQLRGGGGGGVSMPTVINVNVTTGGSGGSGGPQDNAAAQRQAQTIGAAVKAAMNKHLQDQMRPGGIFNPSGGAVM